MRTTATILLILLLCTTRPALAGPWLREQGKTFISTSFVLNASRDQLSMTYIEHGLRERLTIGADIGLATSATGTRGGYATVFMRRPLKWGSDTSKWAYELGVGAAWADDLVLPHAKAGLTWGRGLRMGETTGWTTIDSSVAWDLSGGSTLAKVDATLGLNFTKVTTGMVQLYVTHLDGETLTAIAPSLVFQPKKSKFRVQVGFETPTENLDQTALKLSLWREF